MFFVWMQKKILMSCNRVYFLVFTTFMIEEKLNVLVFKTSWPELADMHKF